MAVRNILTYGDKTLEMVSHKVTKFDDRLFKLLDDMAQTLEQEQGAGLAAPQVGVLRRVAVVHVAQERIELINPEIIATEGEQTGPEGCLSIPERFGLVKRPMIVTVRAQNRFGEWFEKTGEGLCARAFCHEIEHLDGKLFLSKVIRFLKPEELESDVEGE